MQAWNGLRIAWATTGFTAMAVAVASAQGPLEPPGGPAPTMKSLQEIWDRMQALESNVNARTAQAEALAQASGAASQAYVSGQVAELARALGLAVRRVWKTVKVDGDEVTAGSFSSLAFAPDGRPAVAYKYSARCRYACRDGSQWLFETAESGGTGDCGYYPALAFSPQGQAAVAYYNFSLWRGVYTERAGAGAWEPFTFEDGAELAGTYMSLAFAPSGQPAAAYRAGAALCYALRGAGGSWTYTMLEGYAATHVSLAFSPSGMPCFMFREGNAGSLHYAVYDGAAWSVQTVDATADTGEYASLKFASAGRPAVAYRDVSNMDLRYAEHDGTVWVLQTVDGAGDVGKYASLAFSPSGRPCISYRDVTNADLKFAEYDGTVWVLQTVDSEGDVGEYTSLAFSPSGMPCISYYDKTNRDLKFAECTGVQIGP